MQMLARRDLSNSLSANLDYPAPTIRAFTASKNQKKISETDWIDLSEETRFQLSDSSSNSSP